MSTPPFDICAWLTNIIVIVKYFLLFIVAFTATTAFGQKSQDEFVLYSWKYETSNLFGTMKVPKGFTENTRNYREGIITHLTYSDGSVIILNRGLMMQLPFFDGADYIVSEKCEKWGDAERKDTLIHQVFRRGKAKGKDLYWREENTFMRRLPYKLNIAYEKVPKERVDLFNQALDSYTEAASNSK